MAAALHRCEHDIPPFQLEDPSLHQCLGDFAPGGFHNPGESRTRHIHPGCCGLLVKTLKVGQTQGLDFIQSHDNLIQRPKRYAAGLEVD